MRAPLRIAVLECDTPLPPIDARYDGYTGVFRTLLTASAKALNKPDQIEPENGLIISKWDIVNGVEYPKLEDVDAVLLTGSSRSSLPIKPRNAALLPGKRTDGLIIDSGFTRT